MEKQQKTELNKQLKHYTERKDQLMSWLTSHDYNDKNFAQNLSDMRIAECKIESIDRRLKCGELHPNIESFSTGILQLHYSF